MKLKNIATNNAMLLLIFLVQIHGNPSPNVPKLENPIEQNEINRPRKLQTYYITLTFDSAFQTDTCWYSRISEKISQVSVDYNEVTGFPCSFNIPEGKSVQIYFNSNLNDLSYFLSYNEDLEETDIPSECQITDHFKKHIVTIDLSELVSTDITSTAKMFKGYSALTRINFFDMRSINITSMSEMFYGCSSLNEIDFSVFSTSSVTDMSYMFYGCTVFNSIHFYNFDTSSVTSMEYMFAECTSLKSINLQTFTTTQLQTVKGMFSGCSLLESMDFTFFDTDSLTNLDYMFSNCVSLTSLHFFYFYGPNLIETMNYVFNNCNSLKIIDLSNLETTTVTSMNGIFADCTSLIDLEIPNFYMQQLMENTDVFKNVNKLRYINIENMKYNEGEEYNDDTCVNHDCNLPLNYNDKPIIVCQSNKFITNSNILDICCFYNPDLDICQTYSFIVLHFNQNTHYENGFKNEFRESIEFVNYNNSTLTTTSELNILAGTQLEIYFYDIPTSVEKIFSQEVDNNMANVISIDLAFETYMVENMDSMFYGCSSLESISFQNFDALPARTVANLFYGCSKLKTFIAPEVIFTFVVVENTNSMFYGCSSLESDVILYFEDATVTDMGKMFEGCQSLVSINLTHFKTGNVVNMNSMFAHCVKLKSLNLTGFNTSAVKTMDYMFYNCSSLNSLDLSDFNLLQVTSNNQMLTSLKNINYINLFGIQENGQISSSGINTDANIQKVFFVCQKTNLITHSKSYNCCDYYNNEAQCDYPLETTEIITNIENITNITEQIETIYNSVIQNLKDQAYKVVQTKNLVLQYSTVKEQLNNKSQMVSSVDLGKCEDLLREQEGLNETEEFLMVKMDIINTTINATYVQYEIFNPHDYSKVSLEICKNVTIVITVPVILDNSSLSLISDLEDSGYNAFDINDDFYNDICSTYTAQNGADMTLSARKNNIYDSVKEIYLCQDGCEFEEFDTETSKAVCSCNVQESQSVIDISKISFNKTKFFDSFYNTLYNSNFRVLKCVKLVFSLKGMKSNYGSYTMSVLSGVFIAFIAIYLIKGPTKLINIIDYITRTKGINENINNEDIHIEIKEEMEIKGFKERKKKDKDIKFDELQAPIKKGNTNEKGKHYQSKIMINELASNTEGKMENNNADKEISGEEEKNDDENNNNDSETQILDKYKDSNEEEINNLEYENAIIVDKRTFWQFYFSLLKRGQLIIFTFITRDDYNLPQIKILLFIVSFSLYFTINAFFFSDDTMDKIYEDNGIFNFVFQLPQIIYSSLISSVINIILGKLSITESQILEMKKEKDMEKFKEKANKIKKKLKIKLIIFFVLSSVLMLIFWYFISCFCSVYENTQIILIEDTAISFLLSMMYPFGIKLLPGIFRIPALRAPKRDQKYKYKISLLLSMF